MTYEYERDLILMEVEYQSHAEAFLKWNNKPTKTIMKNNFAMEEDERRHLYKYSVTVYQMGRRKRKNSKIQDETRTNDLPTWWTTT